MVGFCHLTDSHHYHYGQKPTMVGICHGGNLPVGRWYYMNYFIYILFVCLLIYIFLCYYVLLYFFHVFHWFVCIGGDGELVH